ncbi:hypothetical protein J5069_07525 [Candidatus Symbiopectobacterium sp. NZEC127]|uniref:hypothetical protein n=1 Tax=Candidatus Symbiopectobacterium sp. NZEC127 TaxID=2820472 RepID=UPI002226DD5F|nr:hypothetical protein [Candidatus Symbiopectobacterium sp. NZEC127]MCW2485746.1 hypothetical protein [Candidatus Symbiopectobacterium sp. NZEC127]
MTPETFICKYIIDHLVAEGFPSNVAEGGGGADAGIEHYRRMSQFSKKGVFDDCLARARQWALGQTTAAERKIGKKKAGKSGTPNWLL